MTAQDTKIKAVGHTVGPWETLNREVLSASGLQVAQCITVTASGSEISYPEAIANARLIAAAPDLLALALAVAEAADLAGSMGNGPLARMARAAIAKAEGRAS